MKKMVLRFLLLLLLGATMTIPLQAQKKQSTLKDTLDNKLDFSNYMINMHGFVPWPTVISEPALGNFGLGMAIVFMSPKKSLKDDEKFHFPDVTALAGMYTLNNSWGAGLFRMGSFPSIGMRYQVGLGYADVNMNFYRSLPVVGDKEFTFKLQPIAFNLDVSENLYRNKIFIGLNYKFARMKVTPEFDALQDTIFNAADFNKNVGTLGLYGEWDSRNSIFTPDKGVRFKALYRLGRSFTGSDFDFDNLKVFTNVFIRPVKMWVCGFKADFEAVTDGTPFYDLPYLNMRGMAMMRYQGQAVFSIETEQRVDLTLRWSLVGFVGTGRSFSDAKYMNDKSWYWAGGAGFRYLVSRIFRLRMGIDVARGPEQFAYYIVFGHFWNR